LKDSIYSDFNFASELVGQEIDHENDV